VYDFIKFSCTHNNNNNKKLVELYSYNVSCSILRYIFTFFNFSVKNPEESELEDILNSVVSHFLLNHIELILGF